MHHNLLEIFDLLSFNEMLKSFYDLTKISYTILDNKGITIFAGQWQKICVDFHRARKESTIFCEEAEYKGIIGSKSKSLTVQKCKNGFYYMFIPITVNGKNLAYLVLTQFLFDEPDKEFFIKQAKEYGYDVEKYLEALDKVPVLSKEEFDKHVRYFESTIKMISKLLEKQIEQQKTEAILTEKKNKLQQEVDNQTKELKEVLEYDMLKTEFFSNISHELRTPINVIYSALQNVNFFMKEIKTENREEKNKVQKYIVTMKQNCHRLIRLINNFLDITKFDSGYSELELQNYNIVECVENITLSVVDYIESTGVEIIFDTNEEEKIIAIDPLQIERVILNLLSNAIKFTKPGGKIVVNLFVHENNVMISVKDTGVGIPEKKLDNIFERFVQADKSFSREKEGSGIGLSLVKSIIEGHGGNISVNSEVGHGTEFNINLPVKVILEDDSNERKIKKNNHLRDNNDHIERVSIEFSDIYL
ncbi:hypothetical protein SH2C18_51540 [Clostridium sediminicola]|uniref:sensor histidine kinase n=1 Tax=Clostridium sediminicola TaxID=3114879 RepID=UPI0031F1E976